MNNVGSTTLLHPVFNNLEQVIIFRRVVTLFKLRHINSTLRHKLLQNNHCGGERLWAMWASKHCSIMFATILQQVVCCLLCIQSGFLIGSDDVSFSRTQLPFVELTRNKAAYVTGQRKRPNFRLTSSFNFFVLYFLSFVKKIILHCSFRTSPFHLYCL